jgi:predicted negative regulator of RcsB-dependent stress response
MSEQTNLKETNKASVLESPEVLVEKITGFESYLEQNKKLISTIGIAVVLAVGGYFGYNWYIGEQDKEAQEAMFHAVYYFEADSLDKALNDGKGGRMGLLSIAENYGGTKAGNLAHFYVGAIYLKKGKYQEAIDHLEQYSGSDLLVTPRANCLTGDAYLELDNKEKALEYYKKAALHAPNKFFSPRYLMKAALVQELMKNYDDAINTYTTVIEKYNESQESGEANKLRARLQQMTGK